MSCYQYECFGLFFLIFLFSQLSSTFQYYAKWTVFIIGSMIASLSAIPWFIIRPSDSRNALWPALGCRWLLRALGVTFEVRGIENIKREHGSVVLMNHQSAIDLTVLAYLWPLIDRATVVSTKELLLAFPFGQAAYLWGTLYIDKLDAIDKLDKKAKVIKNYSGKLLLYPEGTRNESDKLLPFKKGAFHVAVQNQLNIQPVVTSRFRFLDSKRRIFSQGHNIISILPEIPVQGHTKDKISELIVYTQNLMQIEYDRLNAEILKDMKES